MLLGMFPFEHAHHPDPNTEAAHIEVWLNQIKTCWRDHPRVKAVLSRAMSAEVADLLDKLFELDEVSQQMTNDGHDGATALAGNSVNRQNRH